MRRFLLKIKYGRLDFIDFEDGANIVYVVHKLFVSCKCIDGPRSQTLFIYEKEVYIVNTDNVFLIWMTRGENKNFSFVHKRKELTESPVLKAFAQMRAFISFLFSAGGFERNINESAEHSS